MRVRWAKFVCFSAFFAVAVTSACGDDGATNGGRDAGTPDGCRSVLCPGDHVEAPPVDAEVILDVGADSDGQSVDADASADAERDAGEDVALSDAEDAAEDAGPTD